MEEKAIRIDHAAEGGNPRAASMENPETNINNGSLSKTMESAKADDYEDEKSEKVPASLFPLNRMILGDCLEKLKELPDDFVDQLLTDPPYGLCFMGKNWDKAVPSVAVWKECYRVMKPGALAFIMCSARQDCLARMIVNLEEAGFKLDFTSLYWTYASGFPKAHNIGKVLDKREYKLDTKSFVVHSQEKPQVPCVDGSGRKVVDYTRGVSVEDDQGFGGIARGAVGIGQHACWIPVYETESPFAGAYGGFQPKPAVEVIIVAMKPMEEKTFVGQALKNGKGLTWMDDCRIPYADAADKETYEKSSSVNGVYETGLTWGGKKVLDFPKAGARTADYFGEVGEGRKDPWAASDKGRFPANLLTSDGVLDDGRNHPGGGVGGRSNHGRGKGYGFKPMGITTPDVPKDKGGFARFFSLDAWAQKNLPFIIVPKASKREKNAGCDELPSKDTGTTNLFDKCRKCRRKIIGFGGSRCECESPEPEKIQYKNNHPTVKPLKLMAYLITMGSREGDIVLDPFAGSGSTCVAAKLLNRRFIGIEIDPAYHQIATMRVERSEGLRRFTASKSKPAKADGYDADGAERKAA